MRRHSQALRKSDLIHSKGKCTLLMIVYQTLRRLLESTDEGISDEQSTPHESPSNDIYFYSSLLRPVILEILYLYSPEIKIPRPRS